MYYNISKHYYALTKRILYCFSNIANISNVILTSILSMIKDKACLLLLNVLHYYIAKKVGVSAY